jgi:hypothetical protein
MHCVRKFDRARLPSGELAMVIDVEGDDPYYADEYTLGVCDRDMNIVGKEVSTRDDDVVSEQPMLLRRAIIGHRYAADRFLQVDLTDRILAMPVDAVRRIADGIETAAEAGFELDPRDAKAKNRATLEQYFLESVRHELCEFFGVDHPSEITDYDLQASRKLRKAFLPPMQAVDPSELPVATDDRQYVVYGTTGRYDCESRWTVGIFQSEAEAKEFVRRASAIAGLLMNRYGDNPPAGSNPYDPDMSIMDGHISYDYRPTLTLRLPRPAGRSEVA